MKLLCCSSNTGDCSFHAHLKSNQRAQGWAGRCLGSAAQGLPAAARWLRVAGAARPEWKHPDLLAHSPLADPWGYRTAAASPWDCSGVNASFPQITWGFFWWLLFFKSRVPEVKFLGWGLCVVPIGKLLSKALSTTCEQALRTPGSGAQGLTLFSCTSDPGCSGLRTALSSSVPPGY